MKDKGTLNAISVASLIFAATAHREATQALESAKPTEEQLQAALSRREAELI